MEENEAVFDWHFNNVFRNDYHKRHHFDYKNDVPQTRIHPEGSSHSMRVYPGVKYESKVGSNALQLRIPDWITFSNQVLCFFAHCKEDSTSVLFGQKKEYKILYYLEDDTIQVVEMNTKTDNRFRATLLKRHKIPNPEFTSGKYYVLDDFNIGKYVIFYGRTYRISDCDKFTRDYLTRLGIHVPEAEVEESGEQNESDNRSKTLLIFKENDTKRHTLKQFLENDGNILQFYCLWDTSDDFDCPSAIQNKTGPKQMILRYFLADDTVEVRKMLPLQDSTRDLQPSAERTKSTVFIKRGKLPKQRMTEPLPLSRVNTPSSFFYHDGDFHIGNDINVWGRIFHIYGCDDFTKEYMSLKYGVDTSHVNNAKQMLQEPENLLSMPRESAHRAIRDISTTTMDERGKIDFIKFMTKDRTENHGHILRFLARPVQDKTSEKTRMDIKGRFIISYHLMDDTVSIFEQPQHNSGYPGGKFMERTHIEKQMHGTQHSPHVLMPSHFYLGAQLCLNGYKFEIVDCDEYAKKYMEQHCDEFPCANRLEVLRKLMHAVGVNVQLLKKSFSNSDINNSGTVDSNVLWKIIRDHTDETALTEHEIMTLARAYRSFVPNSSGTSHFYDRSLSDQEFSELFLLQNELRKQQFDDFSGLLKYFKSKDVAESGLVQQEDLLRSCLAYPLPVKKHFIRAAISSFKQDNEDYVNYVQFTNTINWKLNTVASSNIYKKQQQHVKDSYDVNYKQLIEDMDQFNNP